MTTRAPGRVSIRPAERADLLEVLRIEQISFPQPWPYAAFENFLGEPGFLVAVGDGRPGDGADAGADEVRGFVVADVVPELGRRVGHVKDLAVHPEWRGRGIGSRLLERAIAVVVGAGAVRARLEVRVGNRPARELYRQFGFEPERTIAGYYDDGEDALLYVADLSGRGDGDR